MTTPASDATIILTLVNGLGQPGQLVFPEHPGVMVPVSGPRGIILFALEQEWVRMRGQPMEKRGWLNKQRLRQAYTKYIGHEVTPEAVGKSVKRLIEQIEDVFASLAVPPVLLERDNNPRTSKGTHLVRDLIIEDLTRMAP